MKPTALGLYAFCLLSWSAAAALRADEPAADPAQPSAEKAATPSQEELDKKFTADMSGATLVGNYTVGSSSGKGERYTISEVKKVKGDTWIFNARIVYGDHDLTVPLPLQVKWAGDTPVITMTDLTVPGLGTYTARVLIYRGQYAGTWSAGDHGGQLFGRIEKQAKDDKPKTETK